MKVIRGLDSAELSFDRSVLSIGNFDGMHRGHQQLIAQGALFAAHAAAPLVVLTFDPHPLTIVRPRHAPQRLSRLQDKLKMLAAAGVEITVVAESTKELLALTPERFIDLVVEKFHPVRMVEGSTFGFGRGRKGTPEMLAMLGKQRGFEVCIIDPVKLQISDEERAPVSSSVVRRLLAEGKVHRAALCLGRPYALWGHVAAGAGRGRDLGFPTANLTDIEQQLPGDGVYAGMATVAGQRYRAGISIGTNPTFGGGARQVEAHLLDFSNEIVEQPISLEFRSWIRHQRKFDSASELADQIASDIRAIRHQDSLEPPEPEATT